MLSILKAEQLKWKRTFIPALLWLTPLVTWLLSAVLMGGSYFQTGAYNWWYTMLLPGALTICCALVVETAFLWQIPLCLFLAAKLGTYLAILFNLAANIVGIVVFADGKLWYIYPFAIGARLICSTIGMLPNGLPVPEGSPLLNTNVIFPGIIMALAWFIIVCFLTAKWFQKREAK